MRFPSRWGNIALRSALACVLASVAARAQSTALVSALSRAATGALARIGAPREQRRPPPEAMLTGMVGSVGRRQDNDKVIRSVVGAVQIAMVDVLKALQRATEHLSHNDTMLSHIAALISHRVIGQEQVNIPVLLDAPALVPTALSATPPLVWARLTTVGNAAALTGTEDTAFTVAWGALNHSTTGGAREVLLHAPSIPQTATYINTTG